MVAVVDSQLLLPEERLLTKVEEAAPDALVAPELFKIKKESSESYHLTCGFRRDRRCLSGNSWWRRS